MQSLRDNSRTCAVWLLAAGLHYSGLLRFCCWWRRRVLGRREAVVLGLHRILAPQQAARTLSEPTIVLLLPTFEKVLRILRRHYEVLPLSRFHDLRRAGNSRPICFLTFDDGWRDTFENACPALRQYRLPATLFVPVGLVDEPSQFWVERLTRVWRLAITRGHDLETCLRGELRLTASPELAQVIAALKLEPAARREAIVRNLEAALAPLPPPEPLDGFMSWEQVQASQCILQIGSHTCTHPLLTHEDTDTVERELVESKEVLEQRLLTPIEAFAYPSGAYDDSVLQAVADAGYSLAFTTRPGRYRCGDEQLAIPRILLHDGALAGIGGRFSPALLHFRLAGWNLRFS